MHQNKQRRNLQMRKRSWFSRAAQSEMGDP
jgi:hypothetical protein